MKKNLPDAAFLKRVRAVLDDGVEQVDTDTLSRLRRARRQALAAAEKRPLISLARFRLPVMGLATACIAILGVFLYFKSPAKPDINRMEDVEILSSREDLDLYAQLDFYTWIAGETDHAG